MKDRYGQEIIVESEIAFGPNGSMSAFGIVKAIHESQDKLLVDHEVYSMVSPKDVTIININYRPDNSIDYNEMHCYGYTWPGMLPLRRPAAEFFSNYLPIYRLYEDNAEGLMDDDDFDNEHLYGVEKIDWFRFINDQFGKMVIQKYLMSLV